MGWFDSAFGKIFENIGTALLGSIASGLVAQGLNTAFAPKPPSRNDMVRDLEAQANVLNRSAQPIRTPEQEESDRMALEASRQKAATFGQLSKEYNAAQAAGPQYTFDPFMEDRLKREALADAAVRGMGESGQAQDLVASRLKEYRLGQTDRANQLHEAKLSNLRQQMVPYSSVERPLPAPLTPTPSVSGGRTTPGANPFSAAPVDITAMLRPNPPDDDTKKKKPLEEGQGALYAQSSGGAF